MALFQHLGRLDMSYIADGNKEGSMRGSMPNPIKILEQRYGTSAQVSPGGILHFNPTCQCLDVTERWCAISGLDAKRAGGEGWTGTLHPDDREQILSTWCEAVRNHAIFKQEHRFRRPDGSVTWVINQSVPEITEDGKLHGFVGIVSDRTRDLAQMVDDLLDSSKLRAGTMRINRRRHRSEEIIAQARLIIMAKAAANQIAVVEDMEADLPEIYADAEKSGRVLLNFAVSAV